MSSHSQMKSEQLHLADARLLFVGELRIGLRARPAWASAPVDGRSSTFIVDAALDGLAVRVDGRTETRALQNLDELRLERALGGVFGDRDVAHPPVVTDAQRWRPSGRRACCAPTLILAVGAAAMIWGSLGPACARAAPGRESRLIEITARAVENMC